MFKGLSGRSFQGLQAAKRIEIKSKRKRFAFRGLFPSFRCPAKSPGRRDHQPRPIGQQADRGPDHILVVRVLKAHDSNARTKACQGGQQAAAKTLFDQRVASLVVAGMGRHAGKLIGFFTNASTLPVCVVWIGCPLHRGL